MFFNKRKTYVLLICGISGSGKTFIRNILEKRSNDKLKFRKVQQCTTRKPRSQEEIDLKVYDFINDSEYEEINNKLIAKTVVNNCKYGTYDDFLSSNKKQQIVNMIIVNRLGYENVIKELKNRKNYKILTVEITLDDEVKDRDDRDVESEKRELQGIADIEIDNSYNNRLNYDKIIKILKENNFIR